MNQNTNDSKADLLEKFQLVQKLQDVEVPTRDIDVQIFLRKLKEPICLFGEGPKERKDRLRLLLVNQISDLSQLETTVPDMIPKYEIGTDLISETKKCFIEFSTQRAHTRMLRERKINQARIDETNHEGKTFQNYETYMSCAADKRPLTSIATCGDAILVGSLSSHATIWSYLNQYETPLFHLTSHTERITSVGFLNNAIAMTSSADKTVKFWDESKEIASVTLNSIPTTICSHPMGQHSLIGLSDGSFVVFDVLTQQTVSRMKSHDGTLTAITSHNDGGLVMTGGADFFGRLWDLRSMKMVKVMAGHSNRLSCVTFDSLHGGSHAISGAADNSIIVWDLRNLSRSKRISAHNSTITSVNCITGDGGCGDLMVSSSSENIKIWSLLDFRTYKTIEDCPSPVRGAAVGLNSFSKKPSIFTASHDGSWRMYFETDFELPD